MTQPTTATDDRPPPPALLDDLQCVTRDPREKPHARYVEVCTGRADLIARSRNCLAAEDDGGADTRCGGHAICRACFDVAVADGWLDPEELG